MSWIRNRWVLVSLLGVGTLMWTVAYRTKSESAPTPFEIAAQPDLYSLADLEGANLLETDFQSDLKADLQVGSMPNLHSSTTTPENVSAGELEIPDNQFVSTVDEFSRVAELPDSMPVLSTESDESFSRYVTLDDNSEFAPIDSETEVELEIESPAEIAQTTETIATTQTTAPIAELRVKQGWQSNPFINDAVEPAAMTQFEESTSVPAPVQQKAAEAFQSTGAVKIETSVLRNDEPNVSPTSAAFNVTEPASMIATTANAQPAMVNQQSSMSNRPPVMLGISESAAQQSVHHIEYGKSLARRSASFAARQEFYSAMGVLAQSNDTQSGTNKYTTALRNAIVAFDEAEDFLITDTENQIGIEVDLIVSAHATRIIGQTQARHLTTSQAMQRYMAYAGQQLEIAGGKNAVAGEALHCLGKLHKVISTKSRNPNSMDIAKSMVYFRASLGADGSNYHSANDLGVLLAESGKAKEAKWLLKQSLMVYPMAQTWSNLAKLHQRTGETELARRAMNEHQLAMNAVILPGPSKEITWVNNEAFIEASSADVEEYSAVVQASAVENTETEESEPAVERQSIAEKIKSIIKR